MSASFTASLADSFADLDTPSFLRLTAMVAAKLDKQHATLYEYLEILVTNSNSTTFAYQKRLAMHDVCERTIKECAAQHPSNGVTTLVQRVEAQKARFERDMLEMEKRQCVYWTEIQRLQATSKWTALKSY